MLPIIIIRLRCSKLGFNVLIIGTQSKDLAFIFTVTLTSWNLLKNSMLLNFFNKDVGDIWGIPRLHTPLNMLDIEKHLLA